MNRLHYFKPIFKRAGHSLAAVWLALSLALAESTPTFAQATTGFISGVVRDASNNPVAGVIVCASPYDGSPGGNCTPPGGSDAYGNYTIGNLTPGSYRVNAGGGNWSFEFYDNTSSYSAATPVTVNAGQTTGSIDFSLSVSGSISGIVRDASGTPITGVGINIIVYPQSGFPRVTCSDANTGQYVLSGLEVGSYLLAAGDSNPFCGTHTYAHEFWPEAPFANTAAPVVISAASPSVSSIDFTLAPGGSISGVLRDVNGAPITGYRISVALVLADASAPTEIYACSDIATGEYQLSHIPLDIAYKVSAVVFPCPNGTDTYGTVWWQDSPTFVGGTMLTPSMSNPNLTNTDFTLRALGDTPSGSNVLVYTSAGFITYDNVTTAGETTVEPVTSNPPPVPANFELLGTFFEVSTTAQFSQSQVCFFYNDAGLTPGDEERIRLYHRENDVLVDVTDSGYPQMFDNVVCGTVSSFSPFGVLVAPYAWSNVLQPVNSDGNSVFKQGSTVPVKFKLIGWSAGITPLAARLYVTKIGDSILGTEVEAVSTSAATTGNLFRYDAGSSNYIFNLSTRSLTRGAYQLRIDLGDGVSHTVNISLR